MEISGWEEIGRVHVVLVANHFARSLKLALHSPRPQRTQSLVLRMVSHQREVYKEGDLELQGMDP